MTREEMIAAVEAEVRRLEQIRALLEQSQSDRFTLLDVSSQKAVPGQKRVLSQDARKRIAQAQKHRWAKQKRESPASTEQN